MNLVFFGQTGGKLVGDLYLGLYEHFGKYIYAPRTQLTSIFEGQPSKAGPFPIKTRAILVLGK